MKKAIVSIFVMLMSLSTSLSAKSFNIEYDNQSGGVLAIELDGEPTNYIVRCDGSQYEWLNRNVIWGLGSFDLTPEGGELKKYSWSKPIQNRSGERVTYEVGDVEVNVTRAKKGEEFRESYVFTNRSSKRIKLSDISINTPFNDNYPDPEVCLEGLRVSAHIWAGANSSYVNAVRMDGVAPHVGLVLTDGSITGYEIHERGREKGNSEVRGAIALIAETVELAPKESYAVSWVMFPNSSNDDFFAKVKRYGFVKGSATKYVVERGEDIKVTFEAGRALKNVKITNGNAEVKYSRRGNSYTVSDKASKLGENSFTIHYNDGEETPVKVLVISSEEQLIAKRAEFIVKHQQMNNIYDLRDGAYMVYDNETDKIWNKNSDPYISDRDEGRERLAMGALLAIQYQKDPSAELLNSLERYAKFVRVRLQAEDYRVFSTVTWRPINRGYNYPWVAQFYIEMYRATKEKRYLHDFIGTMEAMYRNFGYGFYGVGIPIYEGVKALDEAGMTEEKEFMLGEFRKVGEVFIENDMKYPAHEVTYEQGKAAPLVIGLLELYLLTKESRYLEIAKRHLTFLETFGGWQPTYHMNEIAIRHWDGYWFGKYRTFGDTFPHYWSTLTAVAYSRYAEITGDESYQKRAENIVRNHLCLFTEDGRGSAAYVYPTRINGKPGQYYDFFANDQDWALLYYYMVMDRDYSLK